MMETDLRIFGTKFQFNSIKQNTQIEIVESYVYLGQRQTLEDESRLTGQQLASTAIYSWETCLKIRVYNSCAFPAMTYDVETGTLISQANTSQQPYKQILKDIYSQ